MHTPSPKYATIENWCALSGMSRRVAYDRMGTGELTAVKVGGRTLIDVEAGLAWMRSLPPAVIRAPKQMERAASFAFGRRGGKSGIDIAALIAEQSPA